MPRTVTEAKPQPDRPSLTPAATHGARRLVPARFAAGVMAAYLVLCLPVLARRHFDPSVFVNAGAHYVTAGQTRPPLLVKPDSDGYDGQFYYRMAVRPLSLSSTEDGIVFDHPAKRMERLLYPLLAWAVSFGEPGPVAWALFLLNVFGLGAIAWLATDLARLLHLPATAKLAILLWPGFIVTLMHDTTEIASTAFLMAALWAYLRGRLVLYASLAACATLARETTLPLFAGILVYEAAFSRTPAGRWPDWRRLAPCAAALAPFAIWREVLASLAQMSPQQDGLARDIGWPLAGVAQMLWACITGARRWASTPFKDGVIRAIVLLTAVPLLLFCGMVALRLRAAFRNKGLRGPACGWVLNVVLVSLLTAGGPWIDPVAYFRALTDCFVIGTILLFAGGFSPRPRRLALIGGGEMLLVWALCTLQLR